MNIWEEFQHGTLEEGDLFFIESEFHTFYPGINVFMFLRADKQKTFHRSQNGYFVAGRITRSWYFLQGEKEVCVEDWVTNHMYRVGSDA